MLGQLSLLPIPHVLPLRGVDKAPWQKCRPECSSGQAPRNQAHVTIMPHIPGTNFPRYTKPWYSGIRRESTRRVRRLYKAPTRTMIYEPGVAHC